MRQVILVQGDTLEAFVESYNEACCEISRCSIIDQHHISDTKLLLFYEDSSLNPEWFDRKCCECSHYNWGLGCSMGNTKKGKLDPACEIFTTELIEEEVLS